MGSSTPAPTRGVPITIDGKEYRLRYSFATLRAIREELKGDDPLSGSFTTDRLSLMLWYGIGREESGFADRNAFEDALDLAHLQEYTEAFSRATGSKISRTEDGAANPQVAPAPAPEGSAS